MPVWMVVSSSFWLLVTLPRASWSLSSSSSMSFIFSAGGELVRTMGQWVAQTQGQGAQGPKLVAVLNSGSQELRGGLQVPVGPAAHGQSTWTRWQGSPLQAWFQLTGCEDHHGGRGVAGSLTCQSRVPGGASALRPAFPACPSRPPAAAPGSPLCSSEPGTGL